MCLLPRCSSEMLPLRMVERNTAQIITLVHRCTYYILQRDHCRFEGNEGAPFSYSKERTICLTAHDLSETWKEWRRWWWLNKLFFANKNYYIDNSQNFFAGLSLQDRQTDTHTYPPRLKEVDDWKEKSSSSTCRNCYYCCDEYSNKVFPSLSSISPRSSTEEGKLQEQQLNSSPSFNVHPTMRPSSPKVLLYHLPRWTISLNALAESSSCSHP